MTETRPVGHSLDVADSLVGPGQLGEQAAVAAGFGRQAIEVLERFAHHELARPRGARKVLDRVVEFEQEGARQPAHVGEAALGAEALTLGAGACCTATAVVARSATPASTAAATPARWRWMNLRAR